MLWRKATQTDVAMAGTMALSALSASTGGHAGIEIRGVWQEPHRLYTATIAARGTEVGGPDDDGAAADIRHTRVHSHSRRARRRIQMAGFRICYEI